MSLETQPAAWHPIALHGTAGPGPSAKPQMPSAPGRPTLDPPQKGKPGGTGNEAWHWAASPAPRLAMPAPRNGGRGPAASDSHLPLGIRLD